MKKEIDGRKRKNMKTGERKQSFNYPQTNLGSLNRVWGAQDVLLAQQYSYQCWWEDKQPNKCKCNKACKDNALNLKCTTTVVHNITRIMLLNIEGGLTCQEEEKYFWLKNCSLLWLVHKKYLGISWKILTVRFTHFFKAFMAIAKLFLLGRGINVMSQRERC